MKRRVTTNLYDFFTFPAAVDDGVATGEPFRNCVHHFLFNYAYLIFSKSPLTSLMMWRILFKVESLVNGLNLSPTTITMDIIEENVTRSRNSIYCNHCQVVGWSGHPVCRKRYHFIIRADSCNVIQPYQQRCSRCDNLVQLSEPRCEWCNNHETIGDDFEDWMYLQTKDKTHLLHGVVHANGYGHLLTLNGREGGSILLSGHDIMDFWDRLCDTLSIRKVSVMDFSRKFGLEYRLLHAITNGCSWFGNWGYEFGIGSYALTQDAYQKAVHTLSNMPLSAFFSHGQGPRNRLQCAISLYQSLADTELLTIKDLFSFLIALIRQFHKPQFTRTSEQHECTSTSNALCAWTSNDVKDVQNAFIKVLLASGACSEEKWVSWRALKGAVCRKFVSPELVNYSLKHLGGKTTDNGMVVLSQYNPISNAVEFRLELSSNMQNGFDAISSYPPEEQIISDLRFLFASIIHHDKMVSNRSPIMKKLLADSTRKLLDCKLFIKDYKPKQVVAEMPPAIRLWCTVELSDRPKGYPSPPPELIILPWNATVADLKREATSVFQEVYVMYKRFQAEKLPEFGPISDFFTLKFLLGTSGSVRIQGKCLAKQWLNRFRMERGTETWEVDCICGAKDDDGERMLACDICDVWLHTRCAGINDSDDIPSEFVCLRCLNSYPKEAKQLQDSDGEANKTCKSNTAC